MLFEALVRADHRESAESREVEALALRLRAELELDPAAAALRGANRPGAASHEIQRLIHPVALSLGFSSEKKGLYQGSVPGLRPDFFRKVGDSGILLEVERGKTTTNNMDLLDFWKCHLCVHAHYLFLFVPQELRHSEGSGIKREFESVRRRLSAFFRPEHYTNVRAVYLFGY